VNPENMQDKLKEIAEKLKHGKKYEDLQDEVDSFLGPLDNTEKDDLTDEAWENAYRYQGD